MRFKSELAARGVDNVWPLIEAGKLKPIIDPEFDLSDAGAAHDRLDSDKHIGKVILNAKWLRTLQARMGTKRGLYGASRSPRQPCRWPGPPLSGAMIECAEAMPPRS